MQGEDIRLNLTLTFEEAAFGCEKEIKYKRTENCPDCKGTGAKGGGGSDTSSQSADEVYGDTKGRTEGLDKGWTEPGNFPASWQSAQSVSSILYNLKIES